jgi:hypothetical protein
MEWISVKDELPMDGEFVFTYRPMAKESGDEEYTAQKFVSKDYKNTSPQGIVHGFDRWSHPTHWMRIKPPKQ